MISHQVNNMGHQVARPFLKPAIVSGGLDIRVVPGINHCAWIERYDNSFYDAAQTGVAELNAMAEIEKREHIKYEKETRLKSFQEEVAQRVLILKCLKKQEELKKQRKLNDYNEKLLKECLASMDIKASSNKEVYRCTRQPHRIEQQSNKQQPTKSLECVSRKDIRLGTNAASDNGPVVSLADTWTGMNAISNDITSVFSVTSCPLPSKPDVITCAVVDNAKSLENTHDNDVMQERCPVSHLHKKIVLEQVDTGLKQEELMKQHQYWEQRKIFMNLERENVRTKSRILEHKHCVSRLRLVKERENEILQRRACAIKVLEGPHQVKDMQLTDSQIEKSKPLKKMTKEKELRRYMEALRRVAMDRMDVSRVKMQPLCTCGQSFWDCHPDKCAINCVFYRNPRAYVKSLTTALRNLR